MKPISILCSLLLITTFAVSSETKVEDETLNNSAAMVYQVGTLNSLLAGVYEGNISINEVSNFGNFGLGTVNAVNGEMVALDNNFYRIDANGNAHSAKNMNTPFAVVTNFKTSKNYPLGEYDTMDSIHKYIETKFNSKNLIYAVSISGDFSSVRLRSECAQPEGHKPLIETIAKVENKYKFNNVKGTIVGFWFPKYMKNINVTGFHFHFLNDKNTKGGHMLGMKLKRGVLKIMPIYDFRMHLIDTERFRKTNLNLDFKDAAKKVEHKR
ncbi:MAG: acetolactate decarboxylase [Helicobacteraceae bacterium]|nr:acetolactate decarboxylase [Helicobacteraceae bacterium]